MRVTNVISHLLSSGNEAQAARLLVKAARNHDYAMKGVAKEFGVTRRTVLSWLRRYPSLKQAILAARVEDATGKLDG